TRTRSHHTLHIGEPSAVPANMYTQRETLRGLAVESSRQDDPGAQGDGPPMKSGKQIRSNLHELYVVGVRRQLLIGDLLGEFDLNERALIWIDMDFARCAVKIPGSIHGFQIDIRIEQRLHEVITFGDLREPVYWESDTRIIEDTRDTRREVLYVASNYRGSLQTSLT